MQRKAYLGKAAIMCCLFYWGCSQAPSHQARKTASPLDPVAENIIDKAIATHGGMERWNAIKSIEYRKAFVLLDSAGNTESEVMQSHHYTYGDFPTVHISWNSDGQTHELRQEGNRFSKFVDDVLDGSVDEDAIRNSIYTSTYVHGIPYKLLDPGLEITYVGEEQIWTGETCDVLKVDYDPETHSNLTTADVWWYYFSKEDGRVRAGKVKHLDHISGIRNISYKEVDGFLFNHERESHRLSESGASLYLRASYEYAGYTLEIDQ